MIFIVFFIFIIMVDKFILIFFMLIMFSGCSFLLPSKTTIRNDRWTNFNEVEITYNKVVPKKTSIDDLKKFGFDPYKSSNIKIESYLDIMRRFDLLNTGRNIPEPVGVCLTKFNKCQAYVANISYEYDKRIGNALLDLTGFREEVLREGWTFQAVFIIQDSLVVYKVWSGEPIKSEYIDAISPLGPLQALDDLIMGPMISL